MRFLAIITAFLSLTTLARAEVALLGNWSLVSFYTEDAASGTRTNTYGERPTGAIGFTPAGRFFAFATADGRVAATNSETQAAAFRTMIAYTGQWRTEGERFITRVDVAANPALIGSDVVRFWRVEEGRLYITTAPIADPNNAARSLIGTLVWARE